MIDIIRRIHRNVLKYGEGLTAQELATEIGQQDQSIRLTLRRMLAQGLVRRAVGKSAVRDGLVYRWLATKKGEQWL